MPFIARFGPVQHGGVSLSTGLFIGGHVASRGKSTVDIVKVLQRSLCGAATESQIRNPGIIHALDRGYQSALVNQHIHSVGGKIVGTHKRTNRFPFTFGRAPSRFQREIAEKDELSAYWATTKLAGSRSADVAASKAFAVAYRCGLGSVALCYTTDHHYGPGQWSYIFRPKKQWERGTIDNLAGFEDGVQILTEEQRTPDWFLMRRFRVTGSVANRLFRRIARSPEQRTFERDPVTDPDVRAVMMILSIERRGTAR